MTQDCWQGSPAWQRVRIQRMVCFPWATTPPQGAATHPRSDVVVNPAAFSPKRAGGCVVGYYGLVQNVCCTMCAVQCVGRRVAHIGAASRDADFGRVCVSRRWGCTMPVTQDKWPGCVPVQQPTALFPCWLCVLVRRCKREEGMYLRLCAYCWTKQCVVVMSWPAASHVSTAPYSADACSTGGIDGPLGDPSMPVSH
jgi:hypothetical protein